ncbi:MAG: BrxA/BrxB family bacilliredoxin [Planctomycetes bacterium]|nr:BrxA/BrxB family bacilliredoxin [Planctomycetota bacterium]
MYPEEMTTPMRAELTRIGVEELITSDDVQAKVAQSQGTAVVLINSVCGCAAGGARPGLALAMQSAEVKPDKFLTAFAGVHTDAVAAVRSLVPAPASSPSIIMFKDGKPVTMMHRSDIEIRDAQAVAQVLSAMFKEVCA